MHYSLVPLLCLFLTACGSSKTMVLEPTAEARSISGFNLIEGKSTTGVPSDAKNLFYSIIEKDLLESGYLKGNDLTIEYRFVQFDEGSRLSRWMWGGLGNSGEGELTVEVRFKAGDGQELAKIHVGGKIGSGFFGGSFDHAIENAAREVVRYVQKSFPQRAN